MFAGSEDQPGAGVYTVGCYGHGDVVTVVGTHGSKASGSVEAGAFEEGSVGTVPDDGGNAQCSRQAQVAGSIVAFDGDDGDAELAKFEAQPETDLSQADDDDMVAAGENPWTDQADEAGSE